MTNKSLNSHHANAELSVGIVGAGFAGLAVANLLLATTQSKHEAIRIQVLERRRKLDCTNLHHKGTIRLAIPTFSSLQSKLTHISKEDWKSVIVYPKDINDPSVLVVDRYKFLSLLQRSVPILYECPIMNSRQHNSPGNKMQSRLMDQQGHSHGPFDIIVAADGVFSTFRRRENYPLSLGHSTTIESTRRLDRKDTSSFPTCTPIALLGDARWVADIFWDFGRTRIQQGANLALDDAMEFVSLLLQQYPTKNQSKDHPMDHETTTTEKCYHFGKFDIAFCLERGTFRKRFGMVLAMIVLLLLCVNSQQTTK